MVERPPFIADEMYIVSGSEAYILYLMPYWVLKELLSLKHRVIYSIINLNILRGNCLSHLIKFKISREKHEI